jgi:hypothetical protein
MFAAWIWLNDTNLKCRWRKLVRPQEYINERHNFEI